MSNSGPRLLGRRDECRALDRLVADVREGQSRALVLRGEAGVGKSALLEYVVQRAEGCFGQQQVNNPIQEDLVGQVHDALCGVG
jgi:predicted ATPase